MMAFRKLAHNYQDAQNLMSELTTEKNIVESIKYLASVSTKKRIKYTQAPDIGEIVVCCQKFGDYVSENAIGIIIDKHGLTLWLIGTYKSSNNSTWFIDFNNLASPSASDFYGNAQWIYNALIIPHWDIISKNSKSTNVISYLEKSLEVKANTTLLNVEPSYGDSIIRVGCKYRVNSIVHQNLYNLYIIVTSIDYANDRVSYIWEHNKLKGLNSIEYFLANFDKVKSDIVFKGVDNGVLIFNDEIKLPKQTQSVLNTQAKKEGKLPIKHVLKGIKMNTAVANYNNKGSALLSTETSQLVGKLVPQILQDMRKPNFDIAEFGKGISTRPSDVADKLLKTTYASQMENFTNPIQELINICRDANENAVMQDIPSWARLPFLNRLYKAGLKTVDKAKAYFTTVDGQINAVISAVDKQVPHLKQLTNTLESMYEQNREDYYNLEAYILAGEAFIKIKSQELAEKSIETGSDMMKKQDLLDLQDYIDSIQRRVNNFRALQVTCLQNAPSIRIQQQIGKHSLEKFSDMKNIMISAWKQNCSRYIISLEQSKALDMINKSDEATDNLLRVTNDTVNKNAIEAQRALNRGAIKIETLEEINNSLINTLQEIVTIKEQGRQEMLANVAKYQDMTVKLMSKSAELIDANVQQLTERTLADVKHETMYLPELDEKRPDLDLAFIRGTDEKAVIKPEPQYSDA